MEVKFNFLKERRHKFFYWDSILVQHISSDVNIELRFLDANPIIMQRLNDMFEIKSLGIKLRSNQGKILVELRAS